MRRTALAITWLLVLQPTLVSAAEVVGAGSGDQRPDVTAADNGTPVVNIANPNGKGLSHNLYEQFNVGNQGVILNNSRQVTNTQQAGYIEGNPNLRSGSARAILNEVVNANPSQLKGYLEVGGKKADVIVANPWGITCDGCGFINTSRATLTTGVPQLHNGMVQGYAVDRGLVRFEGEGLNADNVDRFDVIARSVELNAKLRGKALNVVTGAQDVAAGNLAVSNIRDPGGKPEFAISSGALGGIYGDRIQLIANEQGVGVNLEAPVAAQNGDITLTANGDIRHDTMQAVGNVAIDAEGQSVASAGRSYAEGEFRINAGRLLNAGEVFADQNLDITADAVSNRGILGGREGVSIKAGTSFVNGWSGAADPDLGAGIFSNQDITIEAPSITNLYGDIYTRGNLTLAGRSGGTADLLDNRSGLIEAEGHISIKADRIQNVRDELQVEEKLTEGWIKHFCHECSGDHFTMTYNVTEVFVNEVIADSGGSHIVAGGDLMLSGTTLKNEASNLLSYGNMTLDVQKIENLGVTTGPFERVSKYGGSMTDGHHVRNVQYGVMPYNRRNFDGEADYWGVGADKDLEKMSLNPEGDNPSYDPDNLILRKNNRIHRKNRHRWTENRTIEGKTKLLGANIVAGGNMDIVNSDGPEGSGGPLIINSEFGHTLKGSVGDVGVNSVASLAESTAAQSQYDDLINGALFHYTSADHPYLVETNPFFTTREGFYGSEYLLRNLGWDPDGTLRLLGDAFFEQKLIREQVLLDTGRVFLDEQFANANEQYKALLDQGIHAAEEMGLAIGVALSPSQINRLNEDIVWMVEKEVAGETVLAPQLYLSPNSMTTDNNGSLIAAQGDLTSEGGSVVNAGSIEADGNMHMDLNEEGLRNLGGSITAGDRLQISSEGDILNLSGRMQADMLDLSARGDITNRRFTVREENGIPGAEAWRTRYADAAVMEGAEGFSLDADGDITISGSEVKGGAGEIRAGGDVNIDTVALESGRKGHYYGGKLDQSKIRHLGSTLSSTLDLLVEADKDLDIIGSDVQGEENVALNSGEDLNILAAANSSRSHFVARHDGETSIRTRNSVRQVQSSVSAGNDLSLSSDKDLLAVAADLEAGGDIVLKSKGDMALLAAKNSDYRYSYSEDDKWYGSKARVSESYSENIVSTDLTAGSNILINTEMTEAGIAIWDAAEGDVLLQGADIGSGGQFIGYAGGDFSITAAESRSFSHSETNRSYSGVAAGVASVGVAMLEGAMPGSSLGIDVDIKGNEARGRGDTSLEETSIDSTGGTTVLAGRDINVVASEVEAAVAEPEEGDSTGEEQMLALGLGDLNMAAGLDEEQEGGRINLLGGREENYSYSRETGMSLGVDFGGGKMSLARHQESASRSETQTWVGSDVTGGGSVTLDSASDINVVGSTVTASGNLNVLSDGDVNVLTGSDIRRSEQSDTFREYKVEVTTSGSSAELFAGYQEDRHAESSENRTAVGSTLVGSNVTVSSERDINLVGATVYGGGVEGEDQGLTGNVTLDAGRDLNTVAGTSEQQQEVIDETFRTGLAVGVQENVSAASDAVGNVDDAEGGLNAASAGLQAVDSVQAARDGGISGSVGYVAEWSRKATESESSQAVGSWLKAANDLALISGRDQHHQGTRASAGNDLLLDVGRDLTMESAQNTYRQSSGSENASVNVGVGSEGGINVTAAGGYSRHRSTDTEQVNSHFSAGNEATVRTEGDAILASAVVSADRVDTDIGGDLTIESRQDTGNVRGESAQVSVTVGNGNVSGTLSGWHTEGDRAWVTQQSGLFATNELDTYVEGHTDLAGGAIISESGDLSLNTETLSYSDLRDYDHYESMQGSIGLGTPQGDTDTGSTSVDSGMRDATRRTMIPGVATNRINAGYESRDVEQITRATIGEGNITVRSDAEVGEGGLAGLNRDASRAQHITRDDEGSYNVYVSDRALQGLGVLDRDDNDDNSRLDQLKDTLDVKNAVAEMGESAVAGVGEIDNAFARVVTAGNAGTRDSDSVGMLNDADVKRVAGMVNSGLLAAAQTVISERHDGNWNLLGMRKSNDLGVHYSRNEDARMENEALRNIMDKINAKGEQVRGQDLVDIVNNVTDHDAEKSQEILSFIASRIAESELAIGYYEQTNGLSGLGDAFVNSESGIGGINVDQVNIRDPRYLLGAVAEEGRHAQGEADRGFANLYGERFGYLWSRQNRREGRKVGGSSSIRTWKNANQRPLNRQICLTVSI